MKKLSIFILTLATAILMVSCDGKKDESIKSEISQKATEVKTDVKESANKQLDALSNKINSSSTTENKN